MVLSKLRGWMRTYKQMTDARFRIRNDNEKVDLEHMNEWCNGNSVYGEKG